MTVEQPRRTRPRPTYRTVRVKRVSPISPHLLRVTFTGDDLAGFTPPTPTQHIKLFFPLPGQDRPVMPEWGPDGPILAEGQGRPISRTYTPRRFDAQAKELDVEFVVHGEGIGSTWAERAKEGDQLVVAGPGGRFQLNTDADWYLMAADPAAIPALGTLLDAVPPAMKVFAFVEVEDPADERALQPASNVQLTWLRAESGKSATGASLEQAIRALTLPSEGRGGAWIGCEAAAMRRVRAVLLDELKFERSDIHTQGYWKQGDMNHTDHDLGDD